LSFGPISKINTCFIQGFIRRSLTTTKIAVVPLLCCSGLYQNMARSAISGN